MKYAVRPYLEKLARHIENDLGEPRTSEDFVATVIYRQEGIQYLHLLFNIYQANKGDPS